MWVARRFRRDGGVEFVSHDFAKKQTTGAPPRRTDFPANCSRDGGKSREHGAEFLLLMIPVNFQVDSRFFDTCKVMLGPGEHKIRPNFFDELKPLLEAAKDTIRGPSSSNEGNTRQLFSEKW